MSRAAYLTDVSRGIVDVREAAARVLSSGEVRVAVARAGVNYWEVMQRRGRVPVGPDQALGTEGSGTVVEVGSGVQGLAPGTRVAWFRAPGSYAEQIVGAAESFYAVPDGVDDDTAAALLFQGATAHYLADETWPLPPGGTAAVTASAGGVGHLLVQLLVRRGVEVVALVSTQQKAAVAESAGASQVLTYDQVGDGSDLAGSCDAVFDAVGGSLPADLLRWLRRRGCLVSYGSSSGREADITPGQLTAGSYFLTRTAGKDYTLDADVARRRAEHLLGLAAEGHVRVHVGDRRPLEEAAAALDAVEARTTTGKVLLVP